MGVFPGVTNPRERRYILRYWWFILGWLDRPPSTRGIPVVQQCILRQMARRAAIEQRLTAAASDHRVLTLRRNEDAA